MPVIPAKKGDVTDLFMRVFMLWLNPKSPNIDQRFIKQLIGHFTFAGATVFPDHVKVGAKELKLIHGAPPKGVQLPGNLEVATRRGSISGMILLNTLRLAHRDERIASVENGMRLTEHHLRKAGAPAKRATMMAAWRTHKSVSHFWAAALLRMDVFKTLNRTAAVRISRKAAAEATDTLPIDAAAIIQMFKDIPRLKNSLASHGVVVPEFMAVAERIRDAAEKYFAPGQKARGKPLLEPDIAWQIPKTFVLPPVKVIYKKLTSDEQKALQTAKKSSTKSKA